MAQLEQENRNLVTQSVEIFSCLQSEQGRMVVFTSTNKQVFSEQQGVVSLDNEMTQQPNKVRVQTCSIKPIDIHLPEVAASGTIPALWLYPYMFADDQFTNAISESHYY